MYRCSVSVKDAHIILRQSIDYGDVHLAARKLFRRLRGCISF